MPAAKKRAPIEVKSPAKWLALFLKTRRGRYPTDVSFAEAIGCSGARLSQILHGAPGLVRPQLAIAIHRETGGAVPGNLWRPDLWRKPADVPVEVDQ
jgi:hypothetical protein